MLLYDHRGFGDSGGEPRQQLNPWVQAREYIAAISFATGLPEIDAAPRTLVPLGDGSPAE